MLDFNSVTSFYQFKDILQQMNEDQEEIDLAYSTLGFTEADFLDDAEVNIPANPVSRVFDAQVGFTSALQKEENDLFAFLQAGGDPDDFQDHFIFDDAVKALLNEFNEVKIGSRIYRALDGEHTLVVANSDMDLFLASRDYPELSSIHKLGIRIFNSNQYSSLFIKDSNGNRTDHNAVIDLTFNHRVVNGTTIQFTNTSFVDFGINTSLNFEWTFSNGDSFNGISPPPIDFLESDFPLTITLKVDRPTGDPVIITKDIPIARICEVHLYDAFSVHNGTFCFDKEKIEDALWFEGYHDYPENDCTAKWFFDDGTTETHSFGETYWCHTLQTEGCHDIMFIPNCLSNCRFYLNKCPTNDPPEPTCDKTGINTGSRTGKIGKETWQVRGKIYCGVTTWTDIMGASTQSYRRKFFRWHQKSPDRHCVSLNGSYYNKVNNVCLEANFSDGGCNTFIGGVRVSGSGNPKLRGNGNLNSTHTLFKNNTSLTLNLSL